MRVVLTSVPVYSHLVPLVIPLARELTKAGHEVAIATGPTMADELDNHGIRAIILPNAVSPRQLFGNPGLAAQLGFPSLSSDSKDPELAARFFAEFLFGAPPRIIGTELVAALSEWRADLIIRESTELGGYLAAEQLGIPHATLDIEVMTSADNMPANWSDSVNNMRKQFGLADEATLTDLDGILRIGVVPDSWYSKSAKVRHYLPSSEADMRPLDTMLARLDVPGPLVLATLGSIVPALPESPETIFRNIIEALGNLPCTGIVALGKDSDPEVWQGPIPDNVVLTSFVQQRKLLQTCDMFITHAGFSGVRESLLAGVPMVAIPVFGDQPGNAARLTELGLGLTVNLKELSAENLRAAGRQVLEDPTFRVAAKKMQRRMFGLPDFSQLARDLEQLVK